LAGEHIPRRVATIESVIIQASLTRRGDVLPIDRGFHPRLNSIGRYAAQTKTDLADQIFKQHWSAAI